MTGLPPNKKIILFDGVCNLCNEAVQFVIKYDYNDTFRFVSLQSEKGIEILKHIGLDTKHADSIVLYEPGIAYYIKSNAALEISKNLGGLFHYGTVFKIIPTFLRDLLYHYVANNRYKWYGKNESCSFTINEKFKNKFL